MSVLRGSTTAERTPCASTPPAPSCASATRATSGSTTIPAQVNPNSDLSDGLEKAVTRFRIGWCRARVRKTDSSHNIRRI